VENLNNGHSFSTRRVTAITHDKPIFYITASFQSREIGFEHQNTMSEVPLPEGHMSELKIAQKLAHMLSEKLLEQFIGQKPLEMRPVKFHNPLKGSVKEPHRYVWLRANSSIPDDLHIHQHLLSYASDLHLLPTALQTHGVRFLEPNMQVATIDHSMWFHRPFRIYFIFRLCPVIDHGSTADPKARNQGKGYRA